MSIMSFFKKKEAAKSPEMTQAEYLADLTSGKTIKNLVELLSPKQCAVIFNTQLPRAKKAKEAVLESLAKLDPSVKKGLLDGMKECVTYMHSPLYDLDKKQGNLLNSHLKNMKDFAEHRVFDPKKDSQVQVAGEEMLTAQVLSMGLNLGKEIMSEDAKDRLETMVKANKAAYCLIVESIAHSAPKDQTNIYMMLRAKGREFLTRGGRGAA